MTSPNKPKTTAHHDEKRTSNSPITNSRVKRTQLETSRTNDAYHIVTSPERRTCSCVSGCRKKQKECIRCSTVGCRKFEQQIHSRVATSVGNQQIYRHSHIAPHENLFKEPIGISSVQRKASVMIEVEFRPEGVVSNRQSPSPRRSISSPDVNEAIINDQSLRAVEEPTMREKPEFSRESVGKATFGQDATATGEMERKSSNQKVIIGSSKEPTAGIAPPMLSTSRKKANEIFQECSNANVADSINVVSIRDSPPLPTREKLNERSTSVTILLNSPERSPERRENAVSVHERRNAEPIEREVSSFSNMSGSQYTLDNSEPTKQKSILSVQSQQERPGSRSSRVSHLTDRISTVISSQTSSAATELIRVETSNGNVVAATIDTVPTGEQLRTTKGNDTNATEFTNLSASKTNNPPRRETIARTTSGNLSISSNSSNVRKIN